MKITRETLKKIIMEEMEKLGERAIEMGSFQADPVGDVNVSTSGTENVTITPSNLRGYTTITLNAPGETVTCIFKNSNWNVIAGNGYALA